jgi:hypothetical protein
MSLWDLLSRQLDHRGVGRGGWLPAGDRSRPRFWRPSIEILENRHLLSTFTPTTFADGGLGSGSLRDAVLQFNADTGTDDDIIQLEAGTYALTIQNVGGRHETAGLTGDLNLTQTSHRWIIQGAGPSTIIDASQLQDRVFDIVSPGAQVVFQDLVIQGGLAQDNGADGALAGTTDALGGGILNNGGDLTLDDVVVQNNLARGGDGAVLSTPGHTGFGGGVYSTGGPLTLTGASITNNQALGGSGGSGATYGGLGGSALGAGLFANGSALDISASRIANNRATGGRGGAAGLSCVTRTGCEAFAGSGGTALGGGLYLYGGSVSVASSTIASNQATGGPPGFILWGNPGNPGSGEAGGLFISSDAGTVTASTLSGNFASDGDGFGGDGGGIENDLGTLTVSNSTLTGNSTSSGGGYPPGGGGGIYNYGTLAVSNSTLSGNSTGLNGGGIYNYGALTVSSSTLSGNSAGDYGSGGGIYNSVTGTLTVSDSTLSGNSGAYGGGGIYTYSTHPVTLTNVTLSANRTNTDGGGLYVDSSGSSPVLHNTLIAGNLQVDNARDDVYGRLDPGGDDNLIGDGSGMTGLSNGVNGNQVGSFHDPIDPLLGPLADNGGPTLTHALLPGSPAIDAGNNAYATDWDQRGPGFRCIVNGVIDIGAFEVQAHAHSRPTGQPLPDPVAVQALGMPGGILLAQPPDLPADPSPVPEPGNPHAPAGPLEPAAAPTVGGPPAPATRFVADAGHRQPAHALGPPDACDLDPLAQELLGGP